MILKKSRFILWFTEINFRDLPLVGGKNASLGEMHQNLIKRGVNIPYGFAITSKAFWYFLESSKLKVQSSKSQFKVKSLKSIIRETLSDLDPKNIHDLTTKSKKIRNLILNAEFPEDLEKEIIKAYQKLAIKYKIQDSRYKIQDTNLDVAIRSSATAEDLPSASYAGQLESYLNIRGPEQLLESVKKCFASLFGARTISYSFDHKIDHKKIAVSVGVQKMVRADKACAGTIFTLDTESGFPDVILINGAWGLGENVVKGRVNPDQFLVFKKTLMFGFKPIIGKYLGTKEKKLVYTKNVKRPTKNIFIPKKDQQKFILSDDEILKLAGWAKIIEDHYKKPQDIEWAKDGLCGRLYIVQSRPETVHKGKKLDVLEEYQISSKGKRQKTKILCRGLAIGSKIGQGRANVIKNIKEIGKFKKGEVLVTKITDPDWEPIMKIASAIVTDTGGRTSHAAIVSRELGVPCIVGTGNATKIIKKGTKVTVSCAEGAEGKVYFGYVPYKIKRIKLKGLSHPKTKIMMNVGEPDKAFSLSFIPNDGVGLAREEFIISNYIKIHPKALINFKRIKEQNNKKIIKQIENITASYKDKTKFFVDKLAEGIGRIAAAFYPKDVVFRTSDFKTNEYAALLGGKDFEPKEENPMIGWRGASRYYDPQYARAFGLECQAFKKVREEFGLDNVIIMIPFCRTVEEGKKVLEILYKYFPNDIRIRSNKSRIKHSRSIRGYSRKIQELKVYVMAEIPSNVILSPKFAKIFDGFSIGSNDLTQLTLGVDRDSAQVAHVFDERNEAVKKLISDLIKKAHKAGRKVGICGQAPSDFPEFAKFLVEQGIDSISLNPDTVIKTTLDVLKVEKRLEHKNKITE
jgi:pyruvate,water dikinase